MTTVRVPAKINLQLGVGPARADGYHDLATVFHAVSLYDDVTVAPRAADGLGIRLTLSGEGEGSVPCDQRNLAWRAAALLAEQVGLEPDIDIALRKSIPVAGGMAGGSADAAAVLVACDLLWGAGLGREGLVPLAASLGSDVPFALYGGTMIGSGRGEMLTPVLGRGELHWVIALVDGELSTPAVYAAYDGLVRRPAEPAIDEGLMHALRAGDAAGVAEHLSNDLQAAALSLRPSLARVLEAGMEFGALGGIVSGSGPTCVFLARGQEHALDIAVSLSSAGLVRSVRHVTGPVPGARVVPA